MDGEKQGFKFDGTGYRTESQYSFNVNAIKQISILHEHNVTNKSHKNKRFVCCLGKYLFNAKPISVKCLGD